MFYIFSGSDLTDPKTCCSKHPNALLMISFFNSQLTIILGSAQSMFKNSEKQVTIEYL